VDILLERTLFTGDRYWEILVYSSDRTVRIYPNRSEIGKIEAENKVNRTSHDSEYKFAD
jgi:hypothetical protein